MNYRDFVEAKTPIPTENGHPVEASDINPILFPHQKAIVEWAVRGGQRAIFADFGLGKSTMQLETLRLVTPQGERALIICPLGVRAEFRHDAERLGIDTTFVRRSSEVNAPGIYITNYESVRDGKLDVDLFTSVSLDEASVLRSYGSKTYQSFLTMFDGLKYRYVATATPSPNRYKELIHYAGFLGIMDTGQALTRFFQRDSTKANNLTLYPHKEREFWLWLASWATFLQTPADLGFSDEGYDLPELEVVYEKVETDPAANVTWDNDGQSSIFTGHKLGVAETAAQKRLTLDARVAEMMRIIEAHDIGDDGDQVLLWCDLNDEQRAIEKALDAAGISYSSVYGALSVEESERRIEAWKNREVCALIGKPVMLGQGLNLQQCNRAIFVGLTYKFNDVIQAVHRIYRFGQERRCYAHIVHADTEAAVVKVIQDKWRRHNELTATMSNLIRQHGLNDMGGIVEMTRTIGIERVEASGENWVAANNDCVEETRIMDENSVDLIVTSIPFCYDETTEVLTKRGWMTFDQVEMTDQVATVHPEEHCIEWQYPTAKVWERYTGEMLHFTGRSFDHMVTPNHRMFAGRRGRDELELVEAETITASYENAVRRTHDDGRILRGWRTCLVPPRRGRGDNPGKIAIPSLPADVRAGHGVALYWVESSDFMRLAGWYLSEGFADPFTGRSGGRISIAQTEVNQSHRDEIEQMFLRIGLPPSMRPNQLTVWCRNLAWFLQQEFGHGAANKRIPRWVKDLHPDLLEVLRDTMMKGGGSKDLTSYASISGQLRDDFQEICLSTGWRASVSDSKVVNLGQTQLTPEIRHAPERVDYDGMIGCLTVPNHMLVVRRNGKAFVSGNSNHYEYTPSYNDFGHTDNNDHFWAQMDYLTPELLRILNPGRIYACHVKDRILFGNVTGAGAPTVSPFHAEALMHGLKHGFDYMGMITVTTDVVRENNQSYRLGWTEMCKDGSKMGVGSPEYILLFRKPQSDRSKGYADERITKDKDDYSLGRWQLDADAFWRSSGDRLIPPEDLLSVSVAERMKVFREWVESHIYDFNEHRRLVEALDEKRGLSKEFSMLPVSSNHEAVWSDVNRMLTLNSAQSRKAQALHVCLARDSKVLTRERGYVPIQEVRVGEHTLTHLGNWKPVLVVENTGVQPVVTVKAQGVPGLTLTPDHKLWARDPRSFAREADYARKVEPDWLEAEGSAGAYVNQKLPPVVEDDNDSRVWWMVGRWLADGHRGSRGEVVVSIGPDKWDHFAEMAEPWLGNTVRDLTAKQVALRDSDRQLRNIIDRCGNGAANKRLPAEAFGLSTELAAQLLDGYLSGDGHVVPERDAVQATSVSRDLLLGLSIIVQRVHGAIASVFAGRPEREDVIEGRTVHARQEWVMTFSPPDENRRKTPLVLDDGAWKKIRSVEPAGEMETWNLRVADDASYTAEGAIVKNCPLQFDIVDRLIERYSNTGDMVFDPFGGLGTVPYRAIKLGRKGRCVELNPGYFLDSLKYLRAAEEELNMPSLFDMLDPIA